MNSPISALPTRTKKILIIEPGYVFRPIIARLVQQFDSVIHVMVTNSVDTAVKCIQDQSRQGQTIDLIISDTSHDSVESGMRLWESARRYLPMCEFLMTSDKPMDEILEAFDSLDSGTPNFLPKPFRTDHCQDVVKLLLDQGKRAA